MYFLLMQSSDVTITAQEGILAQSGVTQNIVLTASESQTREPGMRITDGHAEARNTIPSEGSLVPYADLQGILSSSLTPQLNSLGIARAASEQERGHLWQTAAGGYDLAQIPLEARTRKGKCNGAAARVLGTACNSTDHSKRGSVMSAKVQCAGKKRSASNATDANQEHAGTSGSDFEVNVKVLAVLSISTETFFSSRNSGCSSWLKKKASAYFF